MDSILSFLVCWCNMQSYFLYWYNVQRSFSTWHIKSSFLHLQHRALSCSGTTRVVPQVGKTQESFLVLVQCAEFLLKMVVYQLYTFVVIECPKHFLEMIWLTEHLYTQYWFSSCNGVNEIRWFFTIRSSQYISNFVQFPLIVASITHWIIHPDLTTAKLLPHSCTMCQVSSNYYTREQVLSRYILLWRIKWRVRWGNINFKVRVKQANFRLGTVIMECLKNSWKAQN